MADILSTVFTLNFLVPNLVWSLLMAAVVKLFEFVRGQPISVKRRGLFWMATVVAAFVLLSGVTYTIRAPVRPDLRGGFDSVSFVNFGPTPESQSTGVLVLFNVRNAGSPTIVQDWNLTVVPPGKETLRTVPTFIPKVLMLNPPAPFPFVCGRDALYRKSAEEPIANGAMARGFLLFSISGYTLSNFASPVGTELVMTFTDVLGNSHRAKWTWPAVTEPLGYSPGMPVPTSDKPEQACE